MRKNKLNITQVKLILIGLVFIALLFGMASNISKHYLNKETNQTDTWPDTCSTVGEIVKFSYASNNGSLAVVNYYVNGDVFKKEVSSQKYRSNVLGEKYNVLYDCENPANGEVLLYEPLFLTNEKTGETMGKITRVYKFNWGGKGSKYAIEFEYTVDGKKFKKAQNLSPDFNKKEGILKKGDECKVLYSTNNAERAVASY